MVAVASAKKMRLRRGMEWSGGHEVGAFGDGDEGADVVEEVDEEEDEDDLEGAVVEGAADVEMEGGVADGGEGVGGGLVVELVEEESGEHGAEDSEEHEGSDAEDLQDGDEEEAEDGEGGLGCAEVAEGDGVGGAGDDDAGVAEAYEGYEEAYATPYGGVELVRDGGDEALADSGVGEEEEDAAGEEDGSEGGLPGDAHALDYGVGEVGVEAHAGGEGERVVGDGSHEDGAEGGAEAGGGGDGCDGHSGLR